MDEYIRPSPNRAALLTIDTQNDFSLSGAPYEIAGTTEAVPQMQQLVETFRSETAPIIHVVRLYLKDGSNVDLCRKQAIEDGAAMAWPGTDGAELVDELKPTTNVRLDADHLLSGDFQAIGSREWVMYKPRWSAFHRTTLHEFLVDRSIDTVVICGCNFPNCPRTTIYEASERDFRIVFVPDATSGSYERGVRELEDIGVSIKNTEETTNWMTE